MKEPDTFVKAPLYVKYVPKTEEYRVHVFRNKIIDIQRKTLSKEKLQEKNIALEDVNWKIRNLDNCFIYQRANVNPPQSVLDVSKRVVGLCGLDFGAVDIIVGKKDNKPYVLEVNSAPGLQGTTLENYVSTFKDIK
jgi:D-alanine-D-alanine ligase-like ATP-grasp enzyme